MRFFQLISFLAVAVWLWPTHAVASHINLVQIQDTINPGVEDFIKHSIQRSSEEGAELLVILLDTPGGLVTATRGIVQAILSSPVPVVVYVHPRGGQAASAGVFVTVAADIAAMAPGTNIGAAHPVATGGQEMSEAMNEKVVNDMVAFAKSLGAQRGRNVEWLENAVRKSVSITAEEAFEQNVIDIVAEDLPALLERLDGWEIQRAGTSKALKTRGVEQRTIDPGWQYRILRAISNPNIAYILLMIGLAGLYFELSQPGAILPGVIGAISLIMALYALQTLPVNFAGVLLILLAIVFFILEISVVSYGMLSIAGSISLFLGSLMLFRVPGESTRVAYSVLIPTVLIISAFFVAVTSLAVRAQRIRPQAGTEALVGMVGEVTRDLAPEGKVFVSGELWNAVADEAITAGQKVEVLSVDSLKLKVRKIDAR
ncbi:MAG: nodulation protein NfeD [Syntrophobacteraceae bacterium]|nr:nodulation protein NfeD [Syntrophobacteraceae bacterium]